MRNEMNTLETESRIETITGNVVGDESLIENLIVPPTAPEIPGLRFRGFRGEADYPNILAAINASKGADQTERSDTLESVANNYAHLTNCDPYQDMIFAEVNGEVVGYGRAEWHLNDEGQWIGFHLAFLDPAWRRKGIGTAMLRYLEQRLRQVADRLHAEGVIAADTPRLFETFASDTEMGREILLQKEGYTGVRFEHFMSRPLSEPIEITPMPEGLEVRQVSPEQVRAVWEAANEAFRDHWGYIEPSEEEYQRFLEDPITDPSLWMVAWDGDQVAGSVQNFLDRNENEEYQRKRGYTEGISVRRPYRKLGLATALLTRSLQMFKDMEMEEAALGVDSQNLSGAFRVYERVGFRVYKCQTIYRKPL
jgi:ribosomal protein S18 acetylase RimI-like enzyme